MSMLKDQRIKKNFFSLVLLKPKQDLDIRGHFFLKWQIWYVWKQLLHFTTSCLVGDNASLGAVLIPGVSTAPGKVLEILRLCPRGTDLETEEGLNNLQFNTPSGDSNPSALKWTFKNGNRWLGIQKVVCFVVPLCLKGILACPAELQREDSLIICNWIPKGYRISIPERKISRPLELTPS